MDLMKGGPVMWALLMRPSNKGSLGSDLYIQRLKTIKLLLAGG